MTDVIDDQLLTYAEKIDKLLRKAEATDNQDEAEAYTAMAQRLMVKYAVSEQILAAARGLTEPDEIVEDRVAFTGIFRSALFDLGKYVGVNNGCKILILNNASTKDGKATYCYLVGFKSDVERAKMLISSLQIQCATALAAWWKTYEFRNVLSGMEKFKARRDFIFGFASGVNTKLKEAKRQGTQEAVKDHAAATGQDEATVTTSTELVLRTRTEQVNDWYDTRYGKLKGRSRNYSTSGTNARGAGYTAGRSANTGTTGLGGSRGAIGGRS